MTKGEKTKLNKLKKEQEARINKWKRKCNIAGAIIIIIPSFLLSYLSVFWGLALAIFLTVIFLEDGWKIVKADPPHIGVITLWGERMHATVLKEGWTWLPFHGFIFGLIQINFERKPLRFKIETRSFDKSELEIPIGLAVRVNEDNVLAYLDSGKMDEVESHLEDSIDERLREWALSRVEGPATWNELMESGVEAVSILVRKIAPKGDINEILEWAQLIPTSILLQFFKTPRPEKVMINTKAWAKDDWKKVKDDLKKGYDKAKANEVNDEDTKDKLGTFEEEKEKLKVIVGKRRDTLKALQRGNGNLKISSLGITIERLNVGKIKLLGEASKMADKIARESIEAEADKVETENVRNRIKELVQDGFSQKEAKEIVQSERGKIDVNVNEHKISISDDDASKSVIQAVASKIFGGGS